MSMNGIDIASHQKGMDITKVDADFVIIKITQGNYYVNPYAENWVSQAVKVNKPFGLYHYSNGEDPSVEVDFLYDNARKYFGKAIICLDWESNGITKKTGYNPVFGRKDEVDYVYNFVTRFHDRTGIWPFIYMSASVTRRRDWSKVSKNCPLWVAQYANDNLTGYQSKPYKDNKGLGSWKSEAIRQYSPSGTIKGFEQTAKHKLDMDICYITINEWDKYAKGDGSTKIYKPVTPEVVFNVFKGTYGSGSTRRNKLEESGYNPDEVQKKVNEVTKKAGQLKALKEECGEYWEIVKERA